MKKNMNKILSCLIVLILIAVGAGCTPAENPSSATPSQSQVSSTPESTPEPTPEPTPVDPLDALPDTDLNGYTFKVIDYAGWRWEPALGTNAWQDAIHESKEYVKERFNCNIELEVLAADTMFAVVLPALMAGDKVADIMLPTMWQFGNFLTADLTTDLTTVPYLNLDGPHYNQNATDIATIGGKVHATAAAFGAHTLGAWSMHFNKRLIEELGLEDPYELVEQGKWTFDKFREMAIAANKDLNGDGIMGPEDRYGLAGPEGDMIQAMYKGMGQKIINRDSAGKAVFSLNTPGSIDAANKIKQLIQVDKALYPLAPEATWLAHVDAFKNGQALFFGYQVATWGLFAEMEDDYGMVPFPSIDGKNYYSAVDHNVSMTFIPSNNKNLEATGLIMETLALRALKDLDVLFELIGPLLPSQKDTDFVYTITDILAYDLFNFVAVINADLAPTGYGLLFNVVWTNPTLEPASSFAAVEVMAQQLVDDLFNK